MQEPRRADDLQPGRRRVDEEQRLLALGDREHDVDAGRALARDEPLLAVQHPLVAVAHGGGAGGRRGRSRRRARSAPTPRGTRRARSASRSARPGRVSRSRSSSRGPAVDDGEAEPVRRLARLLLERHLAEHRQVAAAERRGHVELREPLRARLAPELVERRRIDLVRLDDRRLERVDLLLEEAADALLQLDGSRRGARGRSRRGLLRECGLQRSVARRFDRTVRTRGAYANARRAAPVPSRIASSSERGERQSPASSTRSPAATSAARARRPARGRARGRARPRRARPRAPARRRCGARRRPRVAPASSRCCRISTPAR